MLLSDLVGIDALAAYTLGRVRVGVDLPVYVLATGDVSDGGASMGDAALDMKIVALDPMNTPVGVAVTGRFLLPTGSRKLPLGSGGPGYEAGLAGSQAFGPWQVAMNLGTRGVPQVDLGSTEWGNQLYLRTGVARGIGEKAGVSVEASASSVYASFLSSPATSPLEAMASAWYRVSPAAVLRLGGGTGITEGIGAPAARILVSLAMQPLEVRDRDLDGVVDNDDVCPDVPEDMDAFADLDGCPDFDNDADTIADVVDACVNVAEDADGWEDTDGCPDTRTKVVLHVTDPAGAPIPGVYSGVGEQKGGATLETLVDPGRWIISAGAPDYIGLVESLEIPDGPPVELTRALERDLQGGAVEVLVLGPSGESLEATWILDTQEPQSLNGKVTRANLVPGAHVVRVHAAGYASTTQPVMIQKAKTTTLAVVMQPARVIVRAERLEIRDKVFFDTGKTTIKKVSYSLLDEVARVIVDNPAVQKVRVEGHTDTRGSDVLNLKLSDGRARAVMTYLLKVGVPAERLSSAGFGETRPVDPTENEAAWEQNRRVEFVIEKRAD